MHLENKSLKRVGIVGFGAIGKHHARNLSTLSHVNFIGIADSNAAARADAASLGYQTYETVDEILEDVDALVLSVPTSLHYEMGMRCVEAGCALLVEKPIAHSYEAGRDLIDHALARGVPLMVGYVERYNPAIVAVRDLIAKGTLGKIFSISARRVGVMPARISDANVLTDIGVHDIDLVAFISGAKLSLKSALGGRAVLTDRLDYASLALDAEGMTVHITSNWITPVKIRDLFITGANGSCEVDYITQSIRFAAARTFSPKESYQGEVEQYSAGQFVQISVQKEEPLRRELEVFTMGLITGDLPDPRISLISLRIAEEATLSIESSLLSHTETLGERL